MLIEIVPKFYYVYRGCLSRGFEDINEAYAHYSLKAEFQYHPYRDNKKYWYQYHVWYGVPRSRGRELVSFENSPKPWMREAHVAQCRCCHHVTDETVLYPEGRST